MCGIWGYNGDSPPNENALKILAMYNLNRGDDGVGVFWDGKIIKGVGTEANIFRFLEKHALLPIEKLFTVIGHNRKSTAGANTIANCHPFSYFTKKQNQKEEIPFAVGAHNGTIKNREELIKKYKVQSQNVDSEEILNIIINSYFDEKNIDVLNDYEGFGCFVWTFPKENKLFIFRGKSGQGEDVSGERPMFYWKKQGENKIYISSMKDSLLSICNDEGKEIKEFEANKIHIIENGVLSTFKRTFDRTARNFVEPYTQTYTYTSNVKNVDAKDVFINFPSKVIAKFNKKNPKRDSNGNVMLATEPFIDIRELMKIRKDKTLGGKIHFCAGRWWKNGHVIGNRLKEGDSLILDDNGYFASSNSHDKKTAKEYFFWGGWMCKSKESMEEMIEIYKKGEHMENINSMNCFNVYKCKKFFLGLVFDDNRLGGYNALSKMEDIQGYSYITGNYTPPFNQGKTYTFNSGHFKKVLIDIPIEENDTEETFDDEEPDTTGEILFEAVETLQNLTKDLESANVTNNKKKVQVLKWLGEAYIFIKEHFDAYTKELKEEVPFKNYNEIY
jgi:predicted glutamine amidotransferase